MGHEIIHLTYDGKKTFNQIYALANQEHKERCEYHSNLDDLRMINRYGVYTNYDEAIDAIEKSDNNWYDQIACKYYEYPNLEHSKAYLKLQERYKEWNKKLYELEYKVHYKDTKSKFISCQKCESKINSNFIKWNKCPICFQDMRPKTTLDTIARYKEIVKDLLNQLKEEEKKEQLKMKSKAKEMWLVKIEYHV